MRHCLPNVVASPANDKIDKQVAERNYEEEKRVEVGLVSGLLAF